MHQGDCGRDPLVDTITAVLVHEHARDVALIRRSLAGEIDGEIHHVLRRCASAICKRISDATDAR